MFPMQAPKRIAACLLAVPILDFLPPIDVFVVHYANNMRQFVRRC
jgi:hypothetical protein